MLFLLLPLLIPAPTPITLMTYDLDGNIIDTRLRP